MESIRGLFSRLRWFTLKMMGFQARKRRWFSGEFLDVFAAKLFEGWDMVF